MGRAILGSLALHALVALLAVLVGGVAPSRDRALPPMVQVQLVSAAELAPMRTRPEPAPEEPVEEEAPEPETAEPVPEADAPERPRAATSDEPTPRPGPDAARRTGPDLPLTLEGRPFPFPWYLEELVRKVQRNWRPTTLTLSATVHFRIDRNGRLDDIEVEKSSGNFLFDQAAMRAVQAAHPLAPLPREFTGDWLGVYLDFDAEARLAE
jgi:TonB family protein